MSLNFVIWKALAKSKASAHIFWIHISSMYLVMDIIIIIVNISSGQNHLIRKSFCRNKFPLYGI